MGEIKIIVKIDERSKKGFHVNRTLEVNNVNFGEFEKCLGDVIIDTIMDMSETKDDFYFLVGEFIGNLHREISERNIF